MRGFGDLRKLMKEAQKLQEELAKRREELRDTRVEATAGGGAVVAVVNGHGELQAVKIAREAVDPGDVEMLEDLIVSAVQEAQRKARELVQEVMGELTGGLPGFPP
ncbi:MAG: YbaB/EbfC family nucleoid-associated protein [Caldiserica bacterium]|nr:YbaB/EbfC family nucleoid-associated protein [Caldisericota bacterium]